MDKVVITKCIFCFFSIFYLGAHKANAQNDKIDSLLKILESGIENDTLKLNTIADLCWEYTIVNPSKIEPYTNELLKLEKEIFGEGKFFKTQIILGYFYKANSNFDLARKHFENTLDIYKEKKDTLNIIRALYRLGDLNSNTYNILKKENADLSFYDQALALLRIFNNNEQLIFIYHGKINGLIGLKKYDEAEKLLIKCDSIYRITNYPGKKRSLGFYHYHQARVHFYKKKYDLAYKSIVTSREIADELNYEDLIIETNFYLGELLFIKKNYQLAEKYFLENLKLQTKRGVIWRANAFSQLISFYTKTDNPDKVLESMPQYISLQDSVIQQISANKYAEYEVAFDVKEKELQNEILTKEKEYQKNKVTFFQIIGFALVVLSGLILGLWYRLKIHASQLKKSSEYKDKILNVMGHDIRSPLISQLTVIQDLIENKSANEKESLKDIYQLSLSVYKISDNVYNWVKRTRGLQNTRYSDCQIYYELLLVVEQYEPLFKTKRLHLHLSVDTTKASIVKGDRLGIQAVIRNLVDNASKYAPEDSDVFVEMTQADNNVYFQITNECLPKPDVSTHRKGQGLFLVKEILEYNEGKIVFMGYEDSKYFAKVSFTLVRID